MTQRLSYKLLKPVYFEETLQHMYLQVCVCVCVCVCTIMTGQVDVECMNMNLFVTGMFLSKYLSKS